MSCSREKLQEIGYNCFKIDPNLLFTVNRVKNGNNWSRHLCTDRDTGAGFVQDVKLTVCVVTVVFHDVTNIYSKTTF